MNIVVVGASGYLGSRLYASLTDRGMSVIPVERRSSIHGSLTVDLRRPEDVERLAEVARDATVVYCANVGGRAEASNNPVAAYEVNARVPARLAAAARRFIYLSTDYVFSGEGPPALVSERPNPAEIYGITKSQGEVGVLASASDGVVVRVSGLFDERGTRSLDFNGLERIEAADNALSTPTAVADVVDACERLIANGGREIVHCVGPQVLSSYEFHALAALRWGYDVRPVLAESPRRRVLAATEQSRTSVASLVPKRSLSESAPGGRTWGCVVFDTVGVFLGERRWRNADDAFWREQESFGRRSSASLSDAEIERTVEAYTINPAFPQLFARLSGGAKTILANNGPAVTFERWVERFKLNHIFDATINSEFDGVLKPSREFFETARRKVGPCLGGALLIDDRHEMKAAAEAAGWASWTTTRCTSRVIERYDVLGAEDGDDET